MVATGEGGGPSRKLSENPQGSIALSNRKLLTSAHSPDFHQAALEAKVFKVMER